MQTALTQLHLKIYLLHCTYLLFFLETVQHLQVSLLYQLLVDLQLVGFLMLIECLLKSLLLEVVVFLLKFIDAGVERLFLDWRLRALGR